jgi:hypothetical protein
MIWYVVPSGDGICCGRHLLRKAFAAEGICCGRHLLRKAFAAEGYDTGYLLLALACWLHATAIGCPKSRFASFIKPKSPRRAPGEVILYGRGMPIDANTLAGLPGEGAERLPAIYGCLAKKTP